VRLIERENVKIRLPAKGQRQVLGVIRVILDIADSSRRSIKYVNEE
jgi:hypothetical protein